VGSWLETELCFVYLKGNKTIPNLSLSSISLALCVRFSERKMLPIVFWVAVGDGTNNWGIITVASVLLTINVQDCTATLLFNSGPIHTGDNLTSHGLKSQC
jgi:hypothetical protein